MSPDHKIVSCKTCTVPVAHSHASSNAFDNRIVCQISYCKFRISFSFFCASLCTLPAHQTHCGAHSMLCLPLHNGQIHFGAHSIPFWMQISENNVLFDNRKIEMDKLRDAVQCRQCVW